MNNLNEAFLGDLLGILQSPTSSDDVLCDAAYRLIELSDERAIGPLLRRLIDESDPPWVRKELVTALGSLVLLGGLDSSGAVDLLLEIFSSESEDDEVRAAAAIALGSIGDARAVESLLDTLESGRTGLTYACVSALGRIGDSRAIDALIKGLKSDRLLVPQTAARGLGEFGSAAERALPALQKLAEQGNEVERRYAIEAIAEIEKSLESTRDYANSH